MKIITNEMNYNYAKIIILNFYRLELITFEQYTRLDDSLKKHYAVKSN